VHAWMVGNKQIFFFRRISLIIHDILSLLK